jgi:hypothetical protein
MYTHLHILKVLVLAQLIYFQVGKVDLRIDAMRYKCQGRHALYWTKVEKVMLTVV